MSPEAHDIISLHEEARLKILYEIEAESHLPPSETKIVSEAKLPKIRKTIGQRIKEIFSPRSS